MNLFLQFKKLLVFLLFMSPFLVIGQTGLEPIVELEVVEGNTVNYTFKARSANPNNIQSVTSNCPSNSFVGPSPSGGFNATLRYISQMGCLASDTIVFDYKKINHQVRRQMVVVKVIPSYIAAKNDYSETGIGQMISVPVTANDTSNRNVLIVNSIATDYNGTAVVNGNSIDFTPNPNFEGIANLDYVVCDDIGNCAKATLHLAVGDLHGYGNDTVQIATHKNKEVALLTPLSSYTLVTAPQNGTIENNSGVLTYVPNNNFHGIDAIVYHNPTSGLTKTIEVDVLNHTSPNAFVKDDIGHVLRDGSVELDILANDLGGIQLQHINIISGPYSGTLTYVSKGVYKYVPNSGYDGVDEFIYSASPNSNGSGAETAKVSVVVSNQMPNSGLFEIRTPKNTPIALNYNVPIQSYGFNIVTNSNWGQIQYLPGQVDTLINGFHIQGFNLLLYIPNNNVIGLDEFEIEFCPNIGNGCTNGFLVKVKMHIDNVSPPSGGTYCVGTDCVWAGDTNMDGVVDLRDLLPVGLCIGNVGVPRGNATINPWYAQECNDWGEIVSGIGIDMKHMDTDGDSIVTELDTLAISQHYDKTHSLAAEPVNFPSGIPLFLGQPDTIYVSGPGDIIRIPILLGESSVPALDMYGLTFSIDFDPTVVDASKSDIVFDQNSWMSYNSPILEMVKKPFDGRLEAGYTRTNGISSSGYGKIGYVDFIIVDDLDLSKGAESKYFARISSSSVMNSSGQEFGLTNNDAIFEIRGEEIEDDESTINDALIVYPNPVRNELNIHLNGNGELVDIEIFDFSGRLLSAEKANSSNHHSVNVGDYLVSGFYVVKAKTAEGVMTKKFELINR